MVTIVVEGIGDIVSRPTGYGRALRKLIIDQGSDLRVVYTDVCDSWMGSNDADLLRNRTETRRLLEDWGAEFLDKSPSNFEDSRKYSQLLDAHVDAVFIATPDRHHIEVARHWLTGNCKRIFIEKPLTNDLDEALQWMSELKDADRKRLIQMDHYLPKIHGEIRYEKRVSEMLRKMGRLEAIRFFMLEDHSGTDENYLQKRADRNGPIENEGRVDALQSGLALDLLPHLLAILYHFGDLRTINVSELRAARYVGVDYDYDKSTEIAGETFAAVTFSFIDNHSRQVTGEAYVGKGIRGSNKFPSMDGNVKVLELLGTWGSIEFDFNSNTESFITGSKQEPIMDLEPDPYYYLLRDVALKRLNRGTDLGMPIATGGLILEKIMSQITSRTCGVHLPTYKLGNKKNNTLPPVLEDLLRGGKFEIQPLALWR
jgi:predicted dehydrogenase